MDADKEKPESLDDGKTENDKDEGKTEPAENDGVKSPSESGAGEKGEAVKEGEGVASEGKDGEEINVEACPPPSALNLEKLSEEVDQYLCSLSAPKDDESAPQDVPNFVKQFALMVEARFADFDSGETPAKWSSFTEADAASFLDAITRLSSLAKALVDLSSQPNFARFINRIGGVLERAISYVEEEFNCLLEDYTIHHDSAEPGAESVPEEPTSEENPPPESETPKEENRFPGYSDETLSNLVILSKTMIKVGYDTECCEAYFFGRRHALEESLRSFGFEKYSIDDVQRMPWETLEREIVSWISTFKQCNSLFTNECNLAKAVFPDDASISDQLFFSLSQGFAATIMNFAGAVSLTKSSSEKLFKFLDIYEALRDIIPTMEAVFPPEWMVEFKTEDSIIKRRLGEAIVSIFAELDNSIKSDGGKTPVPGGAIHPLTRYTMNYLRYACEYKETLERIFKEHQRSEGGDDETTMTTTSSSEEAVVEVSMSMSPFGAEVMKMMELLDENLEAKSKLYKDHALSSIFLMNNGRYIVQKVRGSNELNGLMGDAWCRKKSGDLRQYHKVYQRETWGKLLSNLHPEGLTSHGKVVKPVLKERFKNFNAMFDEIHRTQSSWVVCDEQLQSELRVSISNMVVPAYRSFLGRYSQVFTPGRQTEKYVKYQGEDVENFIEELFDGKK